MKKVISIVLILTTLCSTINAQHKVTINSGADIVSSYIWRGSYNAGASFQPKLEGQIIGFALGAWGSIDFVGQERKEVDLYLNYTYKGFTVGITDYWWDGEGAYNYFRYANNATGHRWEGNLAYRLPVKQFPLRISWNTMFAGNDYNADGKRVYSTYIELDYPFSIGSVDMNATLGAAPWHSPSFLPSDNKGFSVCNVGLGASKTFQLSDHISLPLFSRLIFNPATEDIHIVFGVSLYFSN